MDVTEVNSRLNDLFEWITSPADLDAVLGLPDEVWEELVVSEEDEPYRGDWAEAFSALGNRAHVLGLALDDIPRAAMFASLGMAKPGTSWGGLLYQAGRMAVELSFMALRGAEKAGPIDWEKYDALRSPSALESLFVVEGGADE